MAEGVTWWPGGCQAGVAASYQTDEDFAEIGSISPHIIW